MAEMVSEAMTWGRMPWRGDEEDVRRVEARAGQKDGEATKRRHHNDSRPVRVGERIGHEAEKGGGGG